MTVEGLLMNLGEADVYSFDVLATLGDGSTMVEHWEFDGTNAFESGNIMNYQFNSQFFIGSPESVPFVCVEVRNPNARADDQPANNKNCVPFQGALQWISPYPVPAGDALQVGVVLVREGSFEVQVFDMLGHEMHYAIHEGVEMLNSFSLSTASFANGQYLIRVTQGEDQLQRMFTVQH
jgi:hypothetical protein